MLRYQKVRGGVTILMREGVAADTQEGGKESIWKLGDLLWVLDPSCPTVGKLEQYWPEKGYSYQRAYSPSGGRNWIIPPGKPKRPADVKC